MNSELELIEAIAASLETICPDGVCSSVSAAVEGELALPEIYRERLGQASAGRKAEFIAGRHCARSALQGLADGFESSWLGADADGVPEWPDGFVGAITHSKGVAAAVAAQGKNVDLLGLDLERTDRLRQSAARRVMTTTEGALVGNDLVRASVLFSLKEAFYKAQYPFWRCAGNFRDLSLVVDFESGWASGARLEGSFPGGLRSLLGSLQFRFQMVGPYVLSLVWLAKRD